MADPTKYERDYSFGNYQANQPSRPLPGAELDIELDNIADRVGEAVDAIKDIRRSDGGLKNGIVTADALAPDFLGTVIIPGLDDLVRRAEAAADSAETDAAAVAAEAGVSTAAATVALTQAEIATGAAAAATGAATTATEAADAAAASAAAAEVAKVTWRGPWVTGTAYVLRDAVVRNGTSYIIKAAHTADAASEPGGGVSWATYWDVLALKGDPGDPGAAGPGGGDVSGPASSVNNRIAVFSGTSGKLLADGGLAIDQLATAAQGALAVTALQAIPDDAVTNAKLDNMASGRIKGRFSGGTGNPEDLTASQVRSIINVADGATANSADAALLARANHTGTQAQSTIVGLEDDLAAINAQMSLNVVSFMEGVTDQAAFQAAINSLPDVSTYAGLGEGGLVAGEIPRYSIHVPKKPDGLSTNAEAYYVLASPLVIGSRSITWHLDDGARFGAANGGVANLNAAVVYQRGIHITGYSNEKEATNLTLTQGSGALSPDGMDALISAYVPDTVDRQAFKHERGAALIYGAIADNTEIRVPGAGVTYTSTTVAFATPLTVAQTNLLKYDMVIDTVGPLYAGSGDVRHTSRIVSWSVTAGQATSITVQPWRRMRQAGAPVEASELSTPTNGVACIINRRNKVWFANANVYLTNTVGATYGHVSGSIIETGVFNNTGAAAGTEFNQFTHPFHIWGFDMAHTGGHGGGVANIVRGKINDAEDRSQDAFWGVGYENRGAAIGFHNHGVDFNDGKMGFVSSSGYIGTGQWGDGTALADFMARTKIAGVYDAQWEIVGGAPIMNLGRKTAASTPAIRLFADGAAGADPLAYDAQISATSTGGGTLFLDSTADTILRRATLERLRSTTAGVQVTGLMSFADAAHAMKSFATRAAFVAANAANPGLGLADGQTVYAAGRAYRRLAASSAIADAAGFVPAGEYTVEHWAPAANHADWINAAIAGVDALGGGDLWCQGVYDVQETGTWSASNGDLNACVRVVTTNPVRLRGVAGVSKIRQTGTTRIAHIITFGIRVAPGVTIPAPGGFDGIIFEGNRTTAVSEGVPFEGGHGVNVSSVTATGGDPAIPAYNIKLTNFEVRNTWQYGFAFQRAAWQNCEASNFVVEDTGSDGWDCKFDSSLAGEGSNWVRNGVGRRLALRQADLVGQKAGADLRLGWNIENVSLDLDQPIVGFRFQVPDPAVTPDHNVAPFRQQAANLNVTFSGGVSGTDDASTTINQIGFQSGTDFMQAVNINSYGGHTGFRLRANSGSFTNCQSRGASSQDLRIVSTSGATANGNKFFGGTFVKTLVDSVSEPVVETEFHGVTATTMEINAGSVHTLVVGGKQATFTDSGTDTRRINATTYNTFRAGRPGVDQYVALRGDGSANYIEGVGSAKPMRFDNLSVQDLIFNVQTGRAISARVNDSTIFSVNATGLRLSSGTAVFNNALQVVGERKTGWAAATGTATRTTFATSTVTTAQLAERVKALIDDLNAGTGHGLIGS